MSFVMNPDQVKRREYLGLTGLIVGILIALTGLACLLFLFPLGLAVTGLGCAITAAGIFVLNKIPDVLASPEELG